MYTTVIDEEEDLHPRVKAAMLQDAEILDQVSDTIAVMRQKEVTTYLRTDYLKDNQSLAQVLDASWRQRIMEWMYGVVDHCSLRRDSVATAAFYLDLCAEKGVITSREEYQLAAMTSLQIAIKLCDSTVVKLQSMVALGRGLFSEQDVIHMEAKILSTLGWQVHPPTAVCFLRQFLRLMPPGMDQLTRYMIAEVTRFISEISVCLYKFVQFPPSVVAYAGMILAMDRIDERTLSERERLDIFQDMTRIAKLDHTSPQVATVVAQLRISLEKNVSLQELMESIGAQCCGRNVKMRGLDNYSATVAGIHSPRDVVR